MRPGNETTEMLTQVLTGDRVHGDKWNPASPDNKGALGLYSRRVSLPACDGGGAAGVPGSSQGKQTWVWGGPPHTHCRV